MHRVTIQYARPDDPEAFDRRYLEQHVPLVEPVPGLLRFTWSKPRTSDEPEIYLVAELDFADKETMKAALGSPEMAAAGADADAMGVPRSTYVGEVVTAVEH